MDTAKTIKQKLEETFKPIHIDLINESHRHAGPATDSHFKLIMAAESFEELAQVKRHQAVYKVLKEELSGPVHALALHLYSTNEWEALPKTPDSPRCAGKNNN